MFTASFAKISAFELVGLALKISARPLISSILALTSNSSCDYRDVWHIFYSKLNSFFSTNIKKFKKIDKEKTTLDVICRVFKDREEEVLELAKSIFFNL